MTTQKGIRGGLPYNGLSSADIIRIVYALEGEKLSFDQLYYYERTNLLIPAVKSAPGKGIKRVYSADDLIIIMWLVRTVREGISVEQFRSVMETVREKIPEILSDPHKWFIEIVGKTVCFIEREGKRSITISGNSVQYFLDF